MARLFIKHQPVEFDVDEGVVDEVYYISREILQEHRISYQSRYNNTDVAYVCFVRNGKCWAARNFSVMGNKQVRVECVPFNNDPLSEQMLLADLILN